MIWYIASGVLFAVAIAILVINFVRERKYLKKSTKETLGPDVALEIEEERERNAKLHDKFRKALDDARPK